MRTGTAHLPLHGGRAPSWLFSRMVLLSREITRVVVEEFGPLDMLRRLSDPHWFQAFGCVLGFDWHSSGLTTTTTGALKEAVKGRESDLGLFVAGGKGAVSRKTPGEIEAAAEHHAIARPVAQLVYASRIAAKVDNTALQDGYQIYHHAFFFTPAGEWAVVQQGMNDANGWARRYHWLSTEVNDFVCEPHAAVVAQDRGQLVLNLVAEESAEARRTTTLISAEAPHKLAGELRRAQELGLPGRHDIVAADIRPESLERILLKSYEQPPQDFEHLLASPGIGPKTVRALALIADLVYGVKTSHRDPAKFSFAHGGKDGVPYPVDRPTYDQSIAVLREAVNRARLADRDKLEAIKRLARYEQQG
jgi:hypothetical protein